MANFEPEYSKAVGPGKSGGVRASLSVDTGESGIGQAVMFLGKEMQDAYRDVRNAEEKVELSAAQRKIKEHIIAAQNSVSGDDEADAELWAEAEKNISAVSSKSSRVNAGLQMYRDTHMPTAKDSFTKLHIGAKAKNVHDQFKAEGQTLLANGDLVLYQELLDSRLEAKDITPEAHKALSESALGDSLLQQARDLTASDKAEDRQRAIMILNNMTKLDQVKLSTVQKEYQQKLLGLAKKTSKENSDATIAEVVVQMDNLRGKPALEREAAAQEMKQTLINGGVTGDSLKQYFGMVNDWSQGDVDPTQRTDPAILAKVREKIQRFPETISEDQLYAMVGNGISSKDALTLAKARENNIDKLPAMQREISGRRQDQLKALFNAGKLDIETYNDLANRLTVYTNQNKDFTPSEMDEFYTGLVNGETKGKWYISAGSWLPGFSYFKAMGVASRGKKTLADVDESIARVTRIRERIMTERVINKQMRRVGAERPDRKGNMWRLVEIGETPIDDVYERVE
jgi:hypothetical protein